MMASASIPSDARRKVASMRAILPEGIGYGVGVRVGVGVNVLVGVAVRVRVGDGVRVEEGATVGVGLAGRKLASSCGFRVGASVALGSTRAIWMSIGTGVELLARFVQPTEARSVRSANRLKIDMAEIKRPGMALATPGNHHLLEATSLDVRRIASRLAMIISGQTHLVNCK